MLDPETCLDSTQIAQSQDVPSQHRIEVTGRQLNHGCPDKHLISFLVLRAENVPKIAKRFRLTNQFFVTVTDQTTTKKTESVSIKGQTVQWNKKFDAV